MLEHRLALTLHRWARVNLNKPHLKVLIDHKVIAIKLKAIFPIIYHILDTSCGGFYLLLDLWPYHLLKHIL